jgi:hypothetical protein
LFSNPLFTGAVNDANRRSGSGLEGIREIGRSRRATRLKDHEIRFKPVFQKGSSLLAAGCIHELMPGVFKNLTQQ